MKLGAIELIGSRIKLDNIRNIHTYIPSVRMSVCLSVKLSHQDNNSTMSQAMMTKFGTKIFLVKFSDKYQCVSHGSTF